MAFTRISRAFRRNELLLMASLLAGLVMALLEMMLTWAAGAGIWTFPGFVSAVAFRGLQSAGPSITFSTSQIVVGFAIHLATAMVMGILFAVVAPKLREYFGLDGMDETPSYSLVGLGIGMGVFAVAWWGVLPFANPVMVQGLDPTFLGIAHAVWGLLLGVTRKAWIQTAPQVTRSSRSSAQAAAAGSAHKAPASSSASAGASPDAQEVQADVTTLTPDPSEEFEDEEEDEDDEQAEDEDEFQGWGDEQASGGDELSPWPEPPEETEETDEPSLEEDEETDVSPADRQVGSDTEEPSTPPDTPEETQPEPTPSTRGSAEEEDAGPNMTEHARRSLKGLTGREPDLPPVHSALDTTVTHVAPGRAVCTIEASDRLHDATGAVQSGVLISLGELAATIAMETVAPDSKHATVSSQIQVQGAVEEGHVVAEAVVVEQAGTTTITEVEVRDATGKVLVDARFQAATGDSGD